jgi:hypothetical protein
VADDASASGTQPIIVPADVRGKFGEIVDLILASESMNADERRYWIDILPVMSPDQIAKLKDILARERDQLAAIDQKYARDIDRLADAKALEHAGEERKAKNAERASTEAQVKQEEVRAAEGLLDKMDDA